MQPLMRQRVPGEALRWRSIRRSKSIVVLAASGRATIHVDENVAQSTVSEHYSHEEDPLDAPKENYEQKPFTAFLLALSKLLHDIAQEEALPGVAPTMDKAIVWSNSQVTQLAANAPEIKQSTLTVLKATALEAQQIATTQGPHVKEGSLALLSGLKQIAEVQAPVVFRATSLVGEQLRQAAEVNGPKVAQATEDVKHVAGKVAREQGPPVARAVLWGVGKVAGAVKDVAEDMQASVDEPNLGAFLPAGVGPVSPPSDEAQSLPRQDAFQFHPGMRSTEQISSNAGTIRLRVVVLAKEQKSLIAQHVAGGEGGLVLSDIPSVTLSPTATVRDLMSQVQQQTGMPTERAAVCLWERWQDGALRPSEPWSVLCGSNGNNSIAEWLGQRMQQSSRALEGQPEVTLLWEPLVGDGGEEETDKYRKVIFFKVYDAHHGQMQFHWYVFKKEDFMKLVKRDLNYFVEKVQQSLQTSWPDDQAAVFWSNRLESLKTTDPAEEFLSDPLTWMIRFFLRLQPLGGSASQLKVWLEYGPNSKPQYMELDLENKQQQLELPQGSVLVVQENPTYLPANLEHPKSALEWLHTQQTAIIMSGCA